MGWILLVQLCTLFRIRYTALLKMKYIAWPCGYETQHLCVPCQSVFQAVCRTLYANHVCAITDLASSNTRTGKVSEHHVVEDHEDKGEQGKDVSPQVLVSGDNSGVLTIWSLDEQDGEGALVPQVSKAYVKWSTIF